VASGTFLSEVMAPAQADWYRFVLEELNGLGTMLRFQDDPRGAKVAEIHRRVRVLVDTLAWDAEATLAQTWAFVGSRLHEPDDAWGPSLVLEKLEPDAKRVQDWLAGLEPEARTIIATTPRHQEGDGTR
jgi:hypothetical protein